MKRILSLVVIIIIITIFIYPNIFVEITKTVSFFYALKLTQPSVGIIEDVLITIIAGIISYWIVGKIFNLLSLHIKKIMSLSYSAISILISFGISIFIYNMLSML